MITEERTMSRFANMIKTLRRRGLPIMSLFNRVRPTAICLAVSPIIVDAIYAEQSTLMTAPRTWSHVGEKGGERFAPASANCDPSGSIAMIARISGIVTTLKHVLPNPVFVGWDAIANFSLAVFHVAFFGNLAAQTTAALGHSAFKAIASDGFFDTAIAAA